MRLLHHLVRHSSGTFHFRLVVPADLRERLALRVIKRSLRTHDPHSALAAALNFSARYARLFARLRGDAMARDKFDVDAWLASDLAQNVRPYTIDADRGMVQTDGTAADHANALEMARALIELRKVTPVQGGSAIEQSSGQPAPSVYGTVREAITYWQTVDMSAMRLKATAEDRLKAIEEFAAHVGDKRPIAYIRRPDVAAWVAHLRGTKKNEQSTAKKMASHIKAFFDSAQRAGYYSAELTNPAKNIVKFTKADQEQRAETHGWQAFTLEQLQTIFSPENFSKTREVHTRRAMVIALYTGARVGEIAQMRLAGFSEVEGRPVMSFDGELKSDASRRQVPIHPDLLELGILDWVADQRRRGCTRLLPTVKLDGKSGKGNAISKGFSKLISSLAIKPTIDPDLALTKELDPKLGMHSFRDTAIQAMQGHADVELRKAYVGHKHEGKASRAESVRGSHETAYMRAWTPKEVSRVFSGIRWGDWLAIDALKELLKHSDEEHARAMKSMQRRETTRVRGLEKTRR
jgi:integrase